MHTKSTTKGPKVIGAKRIVMLWIVWGIAWLGAATIQRSVWKPGETFSEYLQRRGVPLQVLRSISPEDSKYLYEIQGGEPFYELIEDNGTLLQALIPLGEEMQIALSRQWDSGVYRFDIVPIVHKEVHDTVALSVQSSCYRDIDRVTNNPRLGFILKTLYKRRVDFRKLRKGDRIVFVYRQKSRLGEPWGQPVFQGAVIRTRGKEHFVFVDRDGNCWSEPYETVKTVHTGTKTVYETVTRKIRTRRSGKGYIRPIPGARITSPFSYKRWHPILHRYRPHLGIDFGARRGTPIHAVNRGRVIYAGWMRGYGKVVKIDHGDGYVSLYAHQSRIRVHRGQYVSRGQIIGYVGSTGRSTGPHLHFGLYRRGRAINPLHVIGKGGNRYVVTEVTERKKRIKKFAKTEFKKVPIPGAEKLKKRMETLLHSSRVKGYRWREIADRLIYVDQIVKHKEASNETGYDEYGQRSR